jgi:hypothetical protein
MVKPLQLMERCKTRNLLIFIAGAWISHLQNQFVVEWWVAGLRYQLLPKEMDKPLLSMRRP